MLRAILCTVAVTLCSLTACTPEEGGGPSGEKVDVAAPEVRACRVLRPSDIAKPSNDSPTVPCSKPHNAETFVVGQFKGAPVSASYDDPSLGAAVFEDCSKRFRKFTGADESLALRTILSWAWFRPSEAAWKAGARWYRCDVVGGTESSSELVELPRTAKGVLLGIPGDRWISCVAGPTVLGAVPVPCTEKHDWRAATTVVVGKPDQKYPGDRLVEVQSRDFCRNSVGAWMNYPIDYEYAYTWMGRGEWEAGQRRAVCWAGTSE